MRIAVIADVHGNLLALDAVLADLRQQSPDIAHAARTGRILSAAD